MDVRKAVTDLRQRYADELTACSVTAVERALSELQRRTFGGGGSGDLVNGSGSGGDAAGSQWYYDAAVQRSASSLAGANAASIERLDEYMESMYEELPRKVQSICCIATLARDLSTMQQLLSHGNHHHRRRHQDNDINHSVDSRIVATDGDSCTA